MREHLITSGFYPEDTILSTEQAREFSEQEQVEIAATSVLYATKVFNDGSYQPEISQNLDNNGAVDVYVSYARSERISTMVLNQRILVIDGFGTPNGLNLRVSYQNLTIKEASR